MAIQTEVWVHDINEQLFMNQEFLKRATDHSPYINNKTVHIPYAGLIAAATKDRAFSSLPGTITQRLDADITYNMSDYTTDPILLSDVEAMQLSYDKRASILKQHTESLSEVIGNQTLYAWAPANSVSGVTRIVRTTGAASTGALASGATGSRSAVTLSDISRAKAILDNDKISPSGRILLVPASIYNAQLLDITEIKQAQMYGSATLPSGVVAQIYGFDIMVRPDVVVYATGATPVIKSVDGSGNVLATNTTDNLGILAFHPDYVSVAKGATKVYIEENKATYYGSLFSALVVHGASKLRADSKGICAIVQQ